MAKGTISILDGSTLLASDLGVDVEAGGPDGDELRSDPHLPDTIERIELVGVPGRWGRADVASAEEVSNVA